MTKLDSRLGAFAALLLFTFPARADHWVFMAYMFGHGSLECEALSSFKDMAESSHGDNLDIWIQLARPNAHCGDSDNPYPKLEKWSGVRRFHNPKYPSKDEGKEILEPMEDPASLTRFITYVKAQSGSFDNNHYMLLIYGHGTGMEVRPFRLTREQSQALGLNAFRVGAKDSGDPPVAPRSFVLSIAAIAQALAAATTPLDVIAFDACVLADIEATYGLHKYTKELVASQERVPLKGFDYGGWLRGVSSTPSLTYADAAKLAVTTYADRYRDAHAPYPGSGLDLFTTLSAVDMRNLQPFFAAFTKFARKLTKLLEGPRNNADGVDYAFEIDAARRKCLSFASVYGVQDQIDLVLFLHNIVASKLPDHVKHEASALCKLLGSPTVEPYRSHQDDQYGASGVSIYFPLPESSLVPLYEKPEVNPFGSDTGWVDFLNAYRDCYPVAPVHAHHAYPARQKK
jgi:hypothetical protein